MINFIKWFWANIDFRAWTFEKRKLANPFLIIWRLFLIPFLAISLLIFCGLVALSGNVTRAGELLDEGWYL